jgi:hypothetical protein
MARTGLYKSEVKKARDALLAKNKHPSVDAVRVELGNTGSKTTIHKYLKELEEEDGGANGSKASISEALQDLVSRLAAQMNGEADARMEALRSQVMEQEYKQAETIEILQKEIAALSIQLQRTETAAHQETKAHAHTRETLQQELIVRHTAEQQVTDLKERLSENETHRQSLEEKHTHARDALEHYRQSVKEQRDQDQRRHEQQIQQLQAEQRQLQQSLALKQEEFTRLNQDAARLVGDLSHAKKAFYDEQGNSRQLLTRLEVFQNVEQNRKVLEVLVIEKEAQVKELKLQIAEAAAQSSIANKLTYDLHLELATSQAKLEAQYAMMEELRTYMKLKESAKDK